MELLSSLSSLVKSERLSYFFNLVASKRYNSTFLFHTINSLVNPAAVCATSVKDCERFLDYFVEKDRTHQSISYCCWVTSASTRALAPSTMLLDRFNPITLCDLVDIVSNIHLTTCKLDILPSELSKQVSGVILPWPLSIVNESLC